MGLYQAGTKQDTELLYVSCHGSLLLQVDSYILRTLWLTCDQPHAMHTVHTKCDYLAFVSVQFTYASDATMQEAVSSRAKTAIGCEPTSSDPKVGEPADFVLFDSTGDWRCRKSISEVVYDAGYRRMTIRHGKLTSADL